MRLSPDTAMISRITLAILALPMYVVGSVSWVMMFYGIVIDGISWEDWSLHHYLLAILFCFILYPLGIYLFATSAKGYMFKRVAMTLLCPLALLLAGLLATPDILSPFILLVFSLVSIFLMLFLLQFWARYP